MKNLAPKDHAEEVAIFRHGLIGALAHRDLQRGELLEEFTRLSERFYRLPGSDTTRTFSVPTFERWFYAYKKSDFDLNALRPKPRGDAGHALSVPEVARELLLEIRREHRSASAALIRRTLIEEGHLEKDALSEPTLRRFYEEHGLNRISLRDGQGPKTRLRWEAERPGALWHGDVCHAAALKVGGARMPVRIHGMLDDASRYVVALEAKHTEREIDMLQLLVDALRRHGAPGHLYLDNGATYRGKILSIACARLGISLKHARPYDPQARGKMERFWRTLREGCLDFMGSLSSLHDINVRLNAWLDLHYHRAPHAGLMGRMPGRVWQEAASARGGDELDEKKLRDALVVRESRRVRRDTTISVEGQDFELEQGFLAGAKVQVGYCPLDRPLAPWVEHEGKSYLLHPVDPAKNARRRRPPRRAGQDDAGDRPRVPFDPAKALLDRAVGRRSAPKTTKEKKQ